MYAATGVLRKEHDAILKMLDAAEGVAARLERGESVDPAMLENLIEFFRLFADRCHHGKEEDVLFPLLEKKGIPCEGGPIGVMLYEHVRGRGLIKQMAEASQAYAQGSKGEGARWAQAARGYANLLRAHIDKENNILFVMAERVLSVDEQASLADSFEKVEVEKMGPGTHERLHAMMGKLLADVLPH